MIKAQVLQSLKFFTKLKAEKQVVVILIVIIMFIGPWLKILLSSESNDKKEALKKCDTQKEHLQFMYDSLLNKNANDKDETIKYLQKIREKSLMIKNEIQKK